MDIGRILHDLIFDYTVRNIALGAAVLGIVSGVLGSFALLRRQSLLGDALAHAALPGVCAAFLIGGQTKDPLVLLLGAAVTGWLAAIILNVIVRHTRIKEDTAMGIVLATFFGVGYVMLSRIQQGAGAGQAGLDKFLYGSASSLVEQDVRTMLILAGVALAIIFVLFKEFKLLTFDPAFLSSLGFPVGRLDILLTTLLVIATVIGLQTVGVVLMSAMLIAPGAAARQWTNRLGPMLRVAMLIGVLSGVLGAVASRAIPRMPTGPAIVVVLTTLALLSFAFGKERGIVWAWLRSRRNRDNIRSDAVLYDMLRVVLRHNDLQHPVPAGMIRGGQAGKVLHKLAEQGLVKPVGSDAWVLTTEGIHRARTVTPALRAEMDNAQFGTAGSTAVGTAGD